MKEGRKGRTDGWKEGRKAGWMKGREEMKEH
jgi:hypothetical protein